MLTFEFEVNHAIWTKDQRRVMLRCPSIHALNIRLCHHHSGVSHFGAAHSNFQKSLTMTITRQHSMVRLCGTKW